MKNFINTNKHAITSGVISVIAAFVLIVPTNVYAGNFFSDLWGDVTNGVGDVAQGVADFGGDVWKGTGQVLQGTADVAGDVWNGTGQVITQVGSWGGDVWNGVGQAATQVGSWGGDVWNASGQVLQGTADVVGDVWNGTGQVVTQVGSWGGDIVNAGSNIAGDVGNWFGGNGDSQLATVYQSETNSANNYSSGSCSGTMSQSQYNSFKQSGEIGSSVSVSGSTGYGYFSNNTDCYMPVSLAAFKMYDNSLATQVLYSSTGVSNVAPHSSLTLNVNLPNCKAQVDTYFGSAPSSPVGDGDINIAATVTSASFCSNTPTPPPTPNPTPTLSVTCYPSPYSIQTGNSINWYANASGGNGSYTYSWSGTDGLSGSSQSVSRGYTNVGSKNTNVTVHSGTQSATATCYANVYQVQDYNYDYNYNYNYGYNYSSGYNYYPYNYSYSYNEALSGSCSAGVSNTSVGSAVTWTATPFGGNGFYTYYWYGDEGLSSNNQYVPKAYSYGGTKNATVTITSNGQSVTRTCSVNVGQVLAYTETNPLVSSVYLSQIPYTGAGDGLKVVLFATALALWSGIISFAALKRREKQYHILSTETDEENKALGSEDKMTEARNAVISDTKAITDIEDYARLHKIVISQSAASELVKLSRLGMANASEIIRKVAESKVDSENEWVTLGEHDIERHLIK